MTLQHYILIFHLLREIADELSIWDDPSEATKTLKVVCHCESLQPPSALPITGGPVYQRIFSKKKLKEIS